MVKQEQLLIIIFTEIVDLVPITGTLTGTMVSDGIHGIHTGMLDLPMITGDGDNSEDGTDGIALDLDLQ